MHVPFSMSDEPDIGDEFRGYSRDSDPDHYLDEPSDTPYTRSFYTQSEVNAAIRQAVDMVTTMLIKAHQQTVDSYRAEILELVSEIDKLRAEYE